MGIVEFKEQVKIGLKNMDKEQTVFFAWLCAVRALPFIGNGRNCNYWVNTEHIKHLYSIFNALDFNLLNNIILVKDDFDKKHYYMDKAVAYTIDEAVTDEAVTAIEKAAEAYNKIAMNAIAKFNAIDEAAYPYANAFDEAEYESVYDAAKDADAAKAAAYAAKDAAYAAIARDAYHTYAAAVNAAYNAANASATYKKYAADAKAYYMRDILIEDIKSIRDSKRISDKGLRIYGRVWDNFQIELKKVGCEYWGNVYKEIFENNFEFNQKTLKELENRMRVPKSVQEQGAARVAAYLEAIEKEGAENLNEARIIILGEKGSGKTCLARRLIKHDAKMTNYQDSTAGVDTTLWRLEQEDINIHIWDFAGHTVTHAVHKFFLSERCLYILVYDGRSEDRNRIDYWLSQINNYGDKSEVFFLVNKRDNHIPDIPINSLNDKYSIVGKKYYTLSIKKDKKLLDEFRKDVIEYIKHNPSWSNQIIPSNYFKVKKKLEKKFDENKDIEHITIDEFNQIAQENGVEKKEELLKSLHALGICLRYEGLGDLDTLVLNPEWISNGIYRIINWVQEQGGHSVDMNDFSIIFESEGVRYPKSKHPFLYKLMKRYELAYETEGQECLIIPHLLREDRPIELPKFANNESLKFVYQAKQALPPNPISSFIVRHNKEIKNNMVWRHGAVLEDGKGSIALVREWTDERKITIEVKGKEKTAYQDELKKTLNNIFDDIFKSNERGKPELQYRIIRSEPIPDAMDKPVPEDQLMVHLAKKMPYLDPITKKLLDLKLTERGFNLTVIHAQTLIIGDHTELDYSTKTFNFYNCNIDLQGKLNDLASILKRKGNSDEAEVLEETAEVLSEVEECKTPEEIRKKGIANKVKRIVTELGDENSKFHKTVKGIKNGIEIAQEIAKGYNEMAQWCGLPQVPRPFLGKE